MDTLLQQLGGALAAFLDHPVVRTTVFVAVGYIAILWLASAWWVLQDLRRRHRDPALPFVAAAAIILASPVLFPLALVVYRVVRPGRTLAEAREHELTDRLTAIDAEATLRCPGCAMVVEEAWLACPACRTRLAHRCLACDRTMGLDWDLCAWCGAEFGTPVATQPLPVRRAAEVPDVVPGYRRTVGAAGL